MTKKLIIEIVFGCFLVFCLFAMKSYDQKVVEVLDDQIVGAEKQIVKDEFTGVTFERIISKTGTENVFDVILSVNTPHNDDIQPIINVFGIVDTSSSHLDDLKTKVKEVSAQIFEYEGLHQVVMMNLAKEKLPIHGHWDLAGIDGLLKGGENETSNLKSIVNEVVMQLHDPFDDRYYVIVFTDQDLPSISVDENSNVKVVACHFDENVATLMETIIPKPWMIQETLHPAFERIGSKENEMIFEVNQYTPITYRVRLKNEIVGFDEEKAYPIVTSSVLHYDLDGKKTLSLESGLVKGKLGKFQFLNKSTLGNQSVSDSTFILNHDEYCNTCLNHQVDFDFVSLKSTSLMDGTVNFERIPSGHQYILKQISSNAHYQFNQTTANVAVVNGKVYVNGSENYYVYENIPKHSEELEVTLTCFVDNQIDDDQPLYYQITKGDGTPMMDYSSVQSNDNGEVVFDPLYFTQTGVYYYKIKCMNRGVNANELLVVVHVKSDLLSGESQLKAEVTYYSNHQTITVSKSS